MIINKLLYYNVCGTFSNFHPSVKTIIISTFDRPLLLVEMYTVKVEVAIDYEFTCVL